MQLTVEQVAIVHALSDLTTRDDGVGALQQCLGLLQIGKDCLGRLSHGELWEDTVGEGGRVGDGRLLGVDGKAHAETAQQVEVEEGAQRQCLAFDHLIVVGSEERGIVVDMSQQVVGVGDAVIARRPDVAYVACGQCCIVVVCGSIVILGSIIVVPLLSQHADEAEGHLLGVGLR